MSVHLETTATMGTTAPDQPAGLRVRRYALVAMPILAGVCLTVAAAMDPAAGISGDTMFQEYAEHPDPLQIKSLAYHWAYAFWIGIALVVASLVRRRGVWLANIAAVLAFAGMTTLPGMLFIDWIDSAAGQLWGTEGVNALHDRIEEISWGMPYFQLPGFLGFALALPLAAFALQRAGLVRWYAPVATLGALVAFMVSNATWPGCVVATACFAVLSVELWRGTR
jgi:hypothetical protein